MIATGDSWLRTRPPLPLPPPGKLGRLASLALGLPLCCCNRRTVGDVDRRVGCDCGSTSCQCLEFGEEWCVCSFPPDLPLLPMLATTSHQVSDVTHKPELWRKFTRQPAPKGGITPASWSHAHKCFCFRFHKKSDLDRFRTVELPRQKRKRKEQTVVVFEGGRFWANGFGPTNR